MKFQARVIDAALFLRVVQTIEKTAKECVLHFTRTHVNFIIPSTSPDNVQLWSAVAVSRLFSTYEVESLHDGALWMELTLGHMERALRSVESEADVKLIKKRGAPFLSFETRIEGVQPITVEQDVPVRLLASSQTRSLVEPQLPDPEVDDVSLSFSPPWDSL
eukprot:TRINITY_DN3913_c0_g1_i2.p1 TRINITY_DN3913_c0_g1~~TRINITY_DN3913_c0_g1_i2.p1  ORF type:complete len:162 (+),score=28.90 TRINITY_DN3913_c0_g1_i2:2-487(+)